MRASLFITLLMHNSVVLGQIDWNKKISINVQNVTLENLLGILQADHNVNVSYGFDNIDSQIPVTLSVSNQSLLVVIHKICIQANLSYTIIDNVIVFRKEVRLIQENVVPNKQVKPPTDTLTFRDVLRDSSYREAAIRLPAQPLFELPPLTLEIPSVIHYVPVAPLKFRKTVSVSVSYGYDFNKFNFSKPPVTSFQYRPCVTESFAVKVCWRISNRASIRIGALQSEKSFHLEYNYQLLDPDDPLPIPANTHVSSRYVTIPLHIGYRIFSTNHLSIDLTAVPYASFLFSSAELTHYLNGPSKKTENFASGYKTYFLGAGLGCVMQYNFFKRWSLVFDSNYLGTPRSVNTTSMEKIHRVISIKTGVAFSF